MSSAASKLSASGGPASGPPGVISRFLLWPPRGFSAPAALCTAFSAAAAACAKRRRLLRGVRGHLGAADSRVCIPGTNVSPAPHLEAQWHLHLSTFELSPALITAPFSSRGDSPFTRVRQHRLLPGGRVTVYRPGPFYEPLRMSSSTCPDRQRIPCGTNVPSRERWASPCSAGRAHEQPLPPGGSQSTGGT